MRGHISWNNMDDFWGMAPKVTSGLCERARARVRAARTHTGLEWALPLLFHSFSHLADACERRQMPGVLLGAGEPTRDTHMISALWAFPFSRNSNLEKASRHSGNFRSRQETSWAEVNQTGGRGSFRGRWCASSMGTFGVGAGSWEDAFKEDAFKHISQSRKKKNCPGFW